MSRADRDTAAADPRPQGARLWFFRFAATIVIPLLALAAAELGLRLAGSGYPTDFLLPVAGREGIWTSNPRFGWRFFPRHLARTPVPLEVVGSKGRSSEEPQAGYRIVVAGGSAARGTPDSAYSFGRVLEAMLEASYPEVRFEVINAAMTAVSSHVVLPIVRDLARHHPDLFVIYLGHNEVVGPWGAATVFGKYSPSLATIRAGIALRSLRLGQLLERLAPRRNGPEAAGGWRGMEMFLEQRVAADDPRLIGVAEHLERNLTDMVRAAEGAGARSLVLTVAANLRDQPPFASLHRDALGADEERWQRLFEAGRDAAAEERWPEAIASLQQAADVDAAYAGLHFHLGRALAASGRLEEARESFVRARDLDALRFRADSRINDTIRRVAARQADRGAVLLDAERALAEAAGGIPGNDLFYEHVHLNFRGNYVLAREVFVKLQGLIPEQILQPAGGDVAPPTPEQVAERLALTPFDARDLEQSILQITSRPPFTGQAGYAETLEAARRRLAQMRRILTAETWRASEALYRRQLQLRPGDLELRRRFATLLQAQGRAEDAAAEWRALLEHLPDVVEWRASLALALADSGRADEARAELRGLLANWPRTAALHTNLGTVLDKEERFDEAAEHYRRAAALDPADPLASFNLATTYLRRGELEAAAEHYRELIARHGDFAPAHHNLGHTLESQGETDAAMASYRRAVELRPDGASARNSLALALEKQGQLQEAFEQYRLAVAWDAGFTPARFNLADLLFSVGRTADAETQYREGLARRPDNVQARYNWAGTLQVLGQEAHAVAELRRVLAERGEDPGALNNLAWILATTDDAKLRDVGEAVGLAERAARATDHRAPEILDTLATAYDAAGRRDEARATRARARELADAGMEPDADTRL